MWLNNEGVYMRGLLLFLFMVLSSFSNAQCLNNGDEVTFTGVLYSKTYQSSDDNPHLVNKWILQLDTPLKCLVDVDSSFDSWDRQITILPLHSSDKGNLSLFLNKRVSVSGQIALAVTANTYTAVLLLADNIVIN